MNPKLRFPAAARTAVLLLKLCPLLSLAIANAQDRTLVFYGENSRTELTYSDLDDAELASLIKGFYEHLPDRNGEKIYAIVEKSNSILQNFIDGVRKGQGPTRLQPIMVGTWTSRGYSLSFGEGGTILTKNNIIFGAYEVHDHNTIVFKLNNLNDPRPAIVYSVTFMVLKDKTEMGFGRYSQSGYYQSHSFQRNEALNPAKFRLPDKN